MDKIKIGIEYINDVNFVMLGVFNELILIIDICIKYIVVLLNIDGKIIIIGGSVKGLGMIYLNMVIMFVFIIIDVLIELNIFY